MSLKCKDEQVLRGCFKKPWHPILIDVYVWLYGRYKEKLLITCSYRTPEHPNDLHGIDVTLRALDFRSRNFEDPEQVAKEINMNWTYDPNRPEKKVAIFHETFDKNGVSRGFHFHIQVCQNTIFEA